MSSYWAGYSGIGMMLSEAEIEKFIEKYRELRSSELEEYCKSLIYVPDGDNEDERRDFIDMVLEKEGGFALSDAFAEGFSFFPYVCEGREYHMIHQSICLLKIPTFLLRITTIMELRHFSTVVNMIHITSY